MDIELEKFCKKLIHGKKNRLYVRIAEAIRSIKRHKAVENPIEESIRSEIEKWKAEVTRLSGFLCIGDIRTSVNIERSDFERIVIVAEYGEIKYEVGVWPDLITGLRLTITGRHDAVKRHLEEIYLPILLSDVP